MQVSIKTIKSIYPLQQIIISPFFSTNQATKIPSDINSYVKSTVCACQWHTGVLISIHAQKSQEAMEEVGEN